MFDFVLGLHEAYHQAFFFSGASTASLCVWKPLGPWQRTTMSERSYTLRESIIHFFSWTTFFSCTTESSSSSQSFYVSVRICVPGGFMLATVLGCVCLGIASIIYLVVRFCFFCITCYDLKKNRQNVVANLRQKAEICGQQGRRLVRWDMSLELRHVRRQGSVWLDLAFLICRRPSEVSTGRPFSQTRRSESLLQKASRILLRIHRQGLQQRHAGNVWTTWRQQPMTTPFLLLTTSSQASALAFLPDNHHQNKVKHGLIPDQWTVTWS